LDINNLAGAVKLMLSDKPSSYKYYLLDFINIHVDQNYVQAGVLVRIAVGCRATVLKSQCSAGNVKRLCGYEVYEGAG